MENTLIREKVHEVEFDQLENKEITKLNNEKLVTAVLQSFKRNSELGKGSLIELHTLKDEEVEIYANNKKIAYGQVVILEQNFGIKITSIIDEEDLVKSLT